MKNLSLFSLLAIGLVACSVQATEIPGGPVSGDWYVWGNPYNINGEITVPSGSTLTIHAGVQVIFQGWYELTVYGFLEALGAENDSILFTSADSISNWKGIKFWGAPDQSHLSYCIVEQGRTISEPIYPESNGGGILCWSSDPVISHCTIRDNWAYNYGGGIFGVYSNALVEYCTISGNTASVGGGISFDQANTNPLISHCTITGNSAEDGGGILCGSSSNITVDQCLIKGNATSYTGGGIAGWYCSASINYCTIIENSGGSWGGGGIACESEFAPTINHCTISRNTGYGMYGGGGIFCTWYSHPTIINTIVEGNNGAMGVTFWNYATAYISYSDFANNTYGNFGGPYAPSDLGQLTTTNANGDSCDVYQNIYLDPLFVNPNIGDFHLQAGSPCIDAGDPNSPLDPDNTIADLGAFYFNQGGPVLAPQIAVSDSALEFGFIAVGNQGTLALTIYNTGDTTLVLYSLLLSSPVFSTNYNPADSLILPGDSLCINVVFAPLQIHAYNATLTIANNDEPVEIPLSGVGIGPIDVILTPLTPPIVIPASGGSFGFHIGAVNLTITPQTFDYWTEIILPNVGSVPIFTGLNYTLPGSVNVGREHVQQVPAFAPSGTYTYFAYVGDYPWRVEDYDSFTFVKEGSNRGGSLGSFSDWFCSNEPFEVEAQLPDLPDAYALSDPYPNPFNPTTAISFELRAASYVGLKVYDTAGRLVATLVDGWREAGEYQVRFDGSGLAAGVYLYRLQAGIFNASGKMVLMK